MAVAAILSVIFGVLCCPALLSRRPKAYSHDPNYTKVPSPYCQALFSSLQRKISRCAAARKIQAPEQSKQVLINLLPLIALWNEDINSSKATSA
jgi:hypothetical protein